MSSASAYSSNKSGPSFYLGMTCGKLLWTFSLFVSAQYLQKYAVPYGVYLFLLFLGGSLVFTALQQPWKSKKILKRNQWVKVWANGILLAVQWYLWSVAVRNLGPVKVLLMEHCEICLLYFINVCAGWSKIQGHKLNGALIMAIGYLILMWAPSYQADSMTDESLNEPVLDFEGEAVAQAVQTSSSTSALIGTVSIILSSLVTLTRRKYKKLNVEVGGTKRLHTLSMATAAATLFPLFLIEYTAAGSEVVMFPPTFWTTYGTIILFSVVGSFYLSSVAETHGVDDSTFAKYSTTAGFVFSIVLSVFFPEQGLNPSTFIAAMLVLWGMKKMTAADTDLESDIPMFNSRSLSVHLGGTKHSSLKLILKHILDSKDSRRIFFFLCINLMFMFVEVVYGVLTNSLGLLSDAGHMLFDCTALAIGLYASYISKLEPNKVYSYGFGRYEVLSGFVNGVFLVFIAFYILVESIERIMEPQEINSDNLLVVSSLGFAVNLVGLCFFHDHHHGHDHGGHSHGHSSGADSHKHEHGHEHHDGCDHGHGHGHSDIESDHSTAITVSGAEDHHHHDHDHDHDHCNGHAHAHGGAHKKHKEGKHKPHSHDHDHDHDHGHSHGHGHGDKHKHGHTHKKKEKKKEKAGHSHSHAEHDHDGHDHHGHDHNHNMHGIFLHVLADTLGSLGVIVSSIFIKYFGWTISDPICSLFISVLIFGSVLPLLQQSADVLLQRTPPSFERKFQAVLSKVERLPGVLTYRNPHLWCYKGSTYIGSLHVQIDKTANEQTVLNQVIALFREKGVNLMTVQIEKSDLVSRLADNTRIEF
eukprot:GILK01006404.1.p1 GENE.GILK01006404.1~~GILK01006404.1.p1  ORF type:complete len:811 (-),score=85.83 GILK01006404.1:111-2543(-)